MSDQEGDSSPGEDEISELVELVATRTEFKDPEEVEKFLEILRDRLVDEDDVYIPPPQKYSCCSSS